MNYQRGNRVFYDSLTGRKLWETGEVWEASEPVSHEEIVGEIKFIDLEVKSFDVQKYYIEYIDVENNQPILKKFDWVEDEPTTEELITKLEEELALIRAEQELGGIA